MEGDPGRLLAEFVGGDIDKVISEYESGPAIEHGPSKGIPRSFILTL